VLFATAAGSPASPTTTTPAALQAELTPLLVVEPSKYSLRATQVYRRENGEWKVAHRHADVPEAEQARGSTTQREDVVHRRRALVHVTDGLPRLPEHRR
jgi:hypothetical protein